MDNKAYRDGQIKYQEYGYDLSKSPYPRDTKEYQLFVQGMTQAFRLNPEIHEVVKADQLLRERYLIELESKENAKMAKLKEAKRQKYLRYSKGS